MANPTFYPKVSFGRESQAGVALIAVLLFLILITIAGVIAVRQSSVDLKVATSDQANVLMLNASDSVLADIEETAKPAHPNYVRMTSERDGILGYFGVQTNDKIGDQLHFCYRPTDPHLFSLTKSRILKYGGGYDRENAEGLKLGVCDSSNSSDYTSARHTTLTQVVIRALDSETAVRFEANTRGELAGTTDNSQVPNLSINSVTVLPSLSQASNSELKECLGRPVGPNDDVKANYGNEGANGSITKCLRDHGIPSVALVEDAQMKLVVEGGVDRETGKSQDAQCLADAECKKALEAN